MGRNWNKRLEMFQDSLADVSNFFDIYHTTMALSVVILDKLDIAQDGRPHNERPDQILFAWTAPIPWLGRFPPFLHCDELAAGQELHPGRKDERRRRNTGSLPYPGNRQRNS